MRKVSILVAVLLMVSVGAFAQTVDSTLEAEVSAAFGAQLDEMATGISNDFSVDWSWTLREEATEEFGEGDVYGYIMVEDFEVSVAVDGAADQSGTDGGGTNPIEFSWGDVEGRLVLGPAYIELGDDNVTSSADEASMVTKIDQNIVALGRFVSAVTAVDPNVGTDYTSEHPGVAVGFEMPDMVMIELGLISMWDWEADTSAADANGTNAYMMSLETEIMAVDMVSVALVATMEFGNTASVVEGKDAVPGSAGNPAGVGISAEYDMPLTADINVVPELGFDYYTEEDGNEDAESRMEVGVGVNLVWPGLGLDEDGDDHIGFIGDADDEEEVTSGVGLGVVYGIHAADLALGGAGTIDENLNTLQVKLGFFEDGGDDGLLPIVGGAFMVNYNQVSGLEDVGAPEDVYSEMGLGVELNADLGVIAPYFGAKYVAEDLGAKWLTDPADPADTYTDTAMFMNIGTDINVISNVTFNIDWSSGDLLWDEDEEGLDEATYGNVYGTLNDSQAQLGELVLETTISY